MVLGGQVVHLSELFGVIRQAVPNHSKFLDRWISDELTAQLLENLITYVFHVASGYQTVQLLATWLHHLAKGRALA
jgi:hypothetical protein